MGFAGVRCFACEWQGPATSWIAVAPRLPGIVQADMVDQAGAIVRSVSVGRGAEILAEVAAVAGTGETVRLRAITSDA